MSKILKVKGCNECPFRYSHYDDFSYGLDTAEVCTLSMNRCF